MTHNVDVAARHDRILDVVTVRADHCRAATSPREPPLNPEIFFVGGSLSAVAAGGSSWWLDEDDLGSRARHSAMTGERIGPRRYQRGSVVESARLWGEARGEVEAAMV